MTRHIDYKDLYEALNDLESKMDKRFDEVVFTIKESSVRIGILEQWRSEIMGKIAVIVGVITLGFTISWEYIKEKFLRG